MERIEHLLFSAACAAVFGGFWGSVVAWFHKVAGISLGLGLFLFLFVFLGSMHKEWWAEEADLGVAPQEGKAV